MPPPSKLQISSEMKVVLLVGITIFILWPGSLVFLVLFAAMLFAVLVDGLASILSRLLHLPDTLSRALVLLLLVVGVSVFFTIAGPRLTDQLATLSERLPEAVEQLQQVAAQQPWGGIPEELDAEKLQPRSGQIVEGVTGIFSTAFGATANVFVVFFIGLYLAFSPDTYVRGMLHLTPKPKRERFKQVLEALGHALRWWLLGRFASMTAVGVLTITGLAIIDLPLAFVLGMIAALFSFVPYLGPIAAAVPALLVGLLDSPLMAFYVLVVYSLVQFLEGNFLTPLIQRYAVSLAPAILLSAQFAFGLFYGLFGVLLATPLAVVTMVLIQMLYVEDVIQDPVRVLGQREKKG